MCKRLFNIVFVCCTTILLGSCQQNRMSEIHKMYQEDLNEYPKEYITHFPKTLPEKDVSFGGSTPEAAYATHYWGLDLFINYEDDIQKDDLLNGIIDMPDSSVIVTGSNIVFLSDISDFCDSINDSSKFSVYPFPNIQEEVSMLNEEFGNEVKYSNDWRDYNFYLIEQKDTIIYDEQKTNSCQLLEQKLGHGFSRGVVVNEKDKILFFWLYFW